MKFRDLLLMLRDMPAFDLGLLIVCAVCSVALLVLFIWILHDLVEHRRLARMQRHAERQRKLSHQPTDAHDPNH